MRLASLIFLPKSILKTSPSTAVSLLFSEPLPNCLPSSFRAAWPEHVDLGRDALWQRPAYANLAVPARF